MSEVQAVIAAALREHRAGFQPGTGAAGCECGWVGPYTRFPGVAMADHLATVAAAALTTATPAHSPVRESADVDGGSHV